ncbi:type IV pilin protein [Kistimonas asteriae]|uniref:type IV pilin protein n=1 Tax=Kistimonas asteriae TaxID=517724 RepID=UPI001BA8B720|nr:type II secretion system GspH family protein [Kistimonas asteriae]
MKQNNNPAKGYSLVEIIFAVLIAAVILAYALYAYQDFTYKAKIQEAARLAYEIRQGVDAHVTSKREFPQPINRTYANMEYVERAETQQDSADTYRVNVYFKRDAFPSSSSQKVFTLYGNLVDTQMEWNECDDACVKNPVDIPPAMPVPPPSNRGIVTTPGGPTTPSIDVIKAYGKTKVVIKFKGGNEHDGAIRANVRATKQGEQVNKYGAKQYYGLENYVMEGGEYPFDLITAELEQFDKNKGAWVKIWSQSVDPAPRGRDVEYEFFETIPTKWKPDPKTPDWAKPEIKYPGDNWNGEGNPNPGGGDFMPKPPKPIYDWGTTHINTLNEAGYVGKSIFTIHYRSGKTKTYTHEQAIGSEHAIVVPSWRGHENPVEKIVVHVQWIGPNCGFLDMGWCWEGVGTKVVQPAGPDSEKRVCFKYWGTVFSRVLGGESTSCGGRLWVR